LDDYVSRMGPAQKGIYFLQAPNRNIAAESPYFTSFEKQRIEVLFCYHAIDTFIMSNLQEYNKRRIISLEQAEAGEEQSGAKQEEKKDTAPPQSIQALCVWIEKVLGDRVLSAKPSQRPINGPAIVVDHQPSAHRKMLKLVDPNMAELNTLPKQKLEVNPDHPVIKRLNDAKDSNPKLALLIMEQVYDNALVAADILDDPRSMLPRLNRLLQQVLDASSTSSSSPTTTTPTPSSGGSAQASSTA